MSGNDQQSNSSPSLRLLLAEDEVMVAWMLIEMASNLGHQVCATVTTESEAVEAVFRLKPDVVVLDYRLAGGGNGLNAARLIRETEDIPIIFCTAYGEGLRPELKALPQVHLLAKPLSLDGLRRALVWVADARAQGQPHRASRTHGLDRA
jgi:CheY-like chemotaxis protein